MTQRGNGRRQTFFEDGDYALYLDLLADAAERAHVEIWSYCLMPNHVHIVNVALERVGNFASFLGEDFDETLSYAALRKAESVGRPIGSSEWLAEMEQKLGRPLAPKKRGPKPKRVPQSNASRSSQ